MFIFQLRSDAISAEIYTAITLTAIFSVIISVIIHSSSTAAEMSFWMRRDAPRLRQEEEFQTGEKFITTGFHMTAQHESDCSQVSGQQSVCEDDEDMARRSQEEGHVDVVFPGTVMHYSCCTFVCELLKCVLYQTQQLPMTYDEMVVFQNQQLETTQLEEGDIRKPIKSSGDSTWQRCQRTLRVLDEVLEHLEELFSLSYVPRVLFILGSSGILPTEVYEVNMEALVLEGSDRSLETSLCLRQLFRTLFAEDLFSDVKTVRLMGTTVMALAHRNCGVEWFKPKVDFRPPTKVKRQAIVLSSGGCGRGQRKPDTRVSDNYIWFQTPVTIKGFCK